jgi:S-adenosylmethionine synthetase
LLVKELAAIRKEGKVMTYLRPDAKSQVTIEYSDDNQPIRIDEIVVSTQHDDFIKSSGSDIASKVAADKEMTVKIAADIHEFLLPRVKAKLPQRVVALFNENIKYFINPTGVFIIGGPHGDTGLTGRKIIVDTFGGRGAHGGGAFSGKDPSKVDRSAAYAARHLAKNLVAAGVSDQALVQVSYAIGVAEPVSINVNTYGTCCIGLSDGELSARIEKKFKNLFKPKSIIDRFGLKNPIYSETAAYGHMGRESYEMDKEVNYVTVSETGGVKTEVRTTTKKKVTFFGWEKLDWVNEIKSEFGI